MKKIITTTILTLGLLQGASTAYAGFSTENFSGNYGGTFSGHLFSAAAVDEGGSNFVPGDIGVEIGTLTFEHIGFSDGAGNYNGDFTFNTTVGGFPPIVGFETINCTYIIDPTSGRVIETCTAFGAIDETIDLQCVLMPSSNSSHDLLGLDLFHHVRPSDLDCVGTVTIPIVDGGGVVADFLIAHIIGHVDNRD